MNLTRMSSLLFYTYFFCSFSFAEPKYNPKEGFTLSDPAKKALDLKYVTVQSLKSTSVPENSLVYFQDKTGIYRLRNQYFKLIEVGILPRSHHPITIQSRELNLGDQIVIEGVSLLRVADLDASGGTTED